VIDARALAREIAASYSDRQVMAVPPSARGLDLAGAYAVERELVRLRETDGHRTAGLKVGFANKAMWRALKLDTLVWAHMYDDTVHQAPANDYPLSIAGMVAPKIEPEIVFRLKQPLAPPVEGATDAGAVLACVESIALGFEIIDCVYPDWKFTPADFVAAYGLHAGLIVGAPLAIGPDDILTLADQLAACTITLRKNGESVAQGGGRNSLKNPALCLGELGSALAKQGAVPLKAGEYVSSGTLTEAQFITPGDTFTAQLEGLNLPPLTARVLP
jgi:2-oxo-3-hexenedioate decarboxylase